MSATTSAFSSFKAPFVNYCNDMPNGIPLATAISAGASFLCGYAVTAAWYTFNGTLFNAFFSSVGKSVVVGAQFAALAVVLTLVNAAVKPLFDRHFPNDHYGKRFFAEIITVAVLVSAPIAISMTLAGATAIAIALKISCLILPAILIRIWNGITSENNQRYFETQLNEYASSPGPDVKARWWVVP